jgi:hypothetical protein
MTNDRHGESCARDVGARVDETNSRKTGKRAAHTCAQRPRISLDSHTLTSDWNTHRVQLLRAFFRDAGHLAARYRVGADDLLAQIREISATQIERKSLLKPVVCIGDLTVATACRLNRSNAWNELWVFAEPSMTRAAMARLPETLALTWTRRYWTTLRRETELGRGLARYDGARPIRLWMVEELLGTLEAERAAGRLAIRQEHLGRPLQLRIVGNMLA